MFEDKKYLMFSPPAGLQCKVLSCKLFKNVFSPASGSPCYIAVFWTHVHSLLRQRGCCTMKYLLNQLHGYYPSAYKALAERKGCQRTRVTLLLNHHGSVHFPCTHNWCLKKNPTAHNQPLTALFFSQFKNTCITTDNQILEKKAIQEIFALLLTTMHLMKVQA